MNEEKKKIPSFQIDVHMDKETGKPKKATISPEQKGTTWYRMQMDRKKDGLLTPEMIADIQKIGINLSKINEKRQYIGKYPNLFVANFPANPKSSKKSKKEYSSHLKEHIVKKGWGKEFAKFHNKRVLIYIIIYLRESRYKNGNDVDNFAKSILDSLKEYIGDDSQVDILIIEKKLLSGYDEKDLDFLEQAIVAVTNPEAKADILKK